MSYIIALDQGTTSSRALLINHEGEIVQIAQKSFQQFFPEPGWVEHDADEIWFSIRATVLEVLQKAGIKGSDVDAIGITNQRETTVAWQKSAPSKTLARAIVWQCRRTQKICEKLKKSGHEKTFRKKTGLLLDPYFSGTKMLWYLQQNQAVRNAAKADDLCFGTIDSFLISRLSSGRSWITDVSNASRTLLMNLKTMNWDEDLLRILKVKKSYLPEIVASSGRLSETSGLDFLPDGIPISGVAGDQQSALFGQMCFSPGEAKCTFGTGSFLLMNSGKKIIGSKFGLLSTVAWQLGGEAPIYALEGGAFICGAAVSWLRDGLGIIKKSSEIEELARKVSSSEGVQFVPALTGLGAPHWDPAARGLICGLTRGSTREHLAFATLEAMSLQNVEILQAMEKDLGQNLKHLRVDGGASKNDLLLQLQSDHMGTTVSRPKEVETTALGAAYLAGLGVGIFSSVNEVKKKWREDRVFKPRSTKAIRTKRLETWTRAVERAIK